MRLRRSDADRYPLLAGLRAYGAGFVVELASVDANLDAAQVAASLGLVMASGGRRAIIVDASVGEVPAQSAHPTGAGDPAAINAEKWDEPVRGVDGGPDSLNMRRWAMDPDQLTANASSDSMTRLKESYDSVIIAAPPVLSILTASVFSQYADAVVLLISPGESKRKDVAEAAASLRAVGASATGTLLVDSHVGGNRVSGADQSTTLTESGDQDALDKDTPADFDTPA